LGIGSQREQYSTSRAKRIPESRKPGVDAPGQFQPIACQKGAPDLPRTNTIMKKITMGYAAIWDPMTTKGLVANSPTDTWCPLVAMWATPNAITLNPRIAATVKPNTAITSPIDHAGNGRCGSGGVGLNAAAGVAVGIPYGTSPHVGALFSGVVDGSSGSGSGSVMLVCAETAV